MAAFCHHCGAKLPGDSRFCAQCGMAVFAILGAGDAPPLPPISSSTQSTVYPWNYIESGRVRRSGPLGAAIHYLCWLAVLAVVGSVLFMFSWVGFVVFFAVLLFLFNKNGRRYGVRYGACPHCREMVSISSHLVAINCPICTKRIFVRGQEFRAV